VPAAGAARIPVETAHPAAAAPAAAAPANLTTVIRQRPLSTLTVLQQPLLLGKRRLSLPTALHLLINPHTRRLQLIVRRTDTAGNCPQ